MVDINEKVSASPSVFPNKRKSFDEPLVSKNGKRAKLQKSTIVGETKPIKNINKQKSNKRKNYKRKVIASENQSKMKNAAKLPQSATDYSSNWKKLLQQMEEEKKKTGYTENQKKNYVPKTKQKVLAKSENENQRKPNCSAKTNTDPEIWFDDVDECLIERNENKSVNLNKETENRNIKDDQLVKEKSFKGLTKAISMDCEMVGVGYKGTDSILARVSIVNQFGHCVYDKYVKPREKVTDYRTAVSGIRPSDIENANNFQDVQKEVSDILTNRILVGHAIRHDLKVTFVFKLIRS